MIDFHTHTFLSDGVLGPSELVRRAHVKGYRAIGLTDHVDRSNLEMVLRGTISVALDLNRYQETFVIPGVEITHAPPGQIGELVFTARELGAALVVVHGESPVEPVAPGTNEAAIAAGVDILAHPGYITLSLAKAAAEKGILLEITARHGHSLTNGHVARIAREAGARLVIDTDTHSPDNLIDRDTAFKVLVGAGLTEDEARAAFQNNEELFAQMKKRLQHP